MEETCILLVLACLCVFFLIKLIKERNRFCYFDAENMVKGILNIEKSAIDPHGD